MPTLTPEQLQAKLAALGRDTLPETERSMRRAVLNIEGEAKNNCTPGHSPYSRAPYSDDSDPNREPPHMRDVMYDEIKTIGTTVRGIVGNPKDYALPVHEGTSKMEARPFITDAIKAKENETIAILSEGVAAAVRRHCR